MYQPYPTGGAEPEPAAPTPPPSIQNAVRLMYVGAAISAVSLIVTLATIGSLRAAIHKANPALSAAKLHSAETVAVVLAIVLGLIGVGLWIWMARANNAGKSWARITATVFFGLDTLSLLATLRQAEPALSRVVSLLTWVVGLCAVILLWQKISSAYFAASRPRPR